MYIILYNIFSIFFFTNFKDYYLFCKLKKIMQKLNFFFKYWSTWETSNDIHCQIEQMVVLL